MRKRWIDDIYRLATKALAHGATRKGVTEIEWDISGRCTRPFSTSFHARPSRGQHSKWIVVRRDTQIPMCVTIITACHTHCDECLKARQRLWTARAIQECHNSVRTWWGTLTLSPDAWMLALSRARAREALQNVDFETLPANEQFALWNAQIQPEITKYLKRVRSEGLRKAGFRDVPGLKPYRYLIVTEAHQSGVPHYHALVHETIPDIPVRKRTLDHHWTLGLVKQWRLITDETPSHYVCKYLSKDARARVRASQAYGETPLGQNHLLDYGVVEKM